VKKLPDDPKERLDLVGKALFGDSYRRKLAAACGVSHSLAYKWPPSEAGLLDQYLLAAVELELTGARRRDKVLTQLAAALRRDALH